MNEYCIIFLLDHIPSSASIPVGPWQNLSLRCVHSLLEHTDVTIMYATCLWIYYSIFSQQYRHLPHCCGVDVC